MVKAEENTALQKGNTVELKNQNGQMLLVEYTREEFITLLKLMKFAETAREVVDHSAL